MQILSLAHDKPEIEKKVHAIIEKYADCGLRSLAVARQEVPSSTKDSPGGPWEFVGLLPLFDHLRHSSAETIRRSLDLSVSVKMIIGDQKKREGDLEWSPICTLPHPPLGLVRIRQLQLSQLLN